MLMTHKPAKHAARLRITAMDAVAEESREIDNLLAWECRVRTAAVSADSN
jgi:hypothetical protein